MQKEEVKHTAGPWNWHEQGDANEYALLSNTKRWVIAFRQNGEILTGQQRANARLIAAAPELLEACQMIAQWMKSEGIAPNRLEEIEKVISKALKTD